GVLGREPLPEMLSEQSGLGLGASGLGNDSFVSGTRRGRRQLALGLNRSIHVACVLDLIRHFTGRFLEFANALAESACQFGQFPRAEQNQERGQDEKYFPATDHTYNHGIHKSYQTNIRLSHAARLVKGKTGGSGGHPGGAEMRRHAKFQIPSSRETPSSKV